MPFIQVVEDTKQQCMQLLKSIGFDKPDIVSSVTLGLERGTLTTKLTDRVPAKTNLHRPGMITVLAIQLRKLTLLRPQQTQQTTH